MGHQFGLDVPAILTFQKGKFYTHHRGASTVVRPMNHWGTHPVLRMKDGQHLAPCYFLDPEQRRQS